MAARGPKDKHEEIRVKVEQAKREVLPAVELEKKEIKLMVVPAPPGKQVPSILMTAFENGSSEELSKSHDTDRIVGIDMGPQTGEPASTESDVPETKKTTTVRDLKPTPQSPKTGSRLTVEQTSSIIEKTENLMEFFQDHDKKGLAKRTTQKKPRTPSPSPVRQSIGLDHLDNLVRLMEQLSNLKDENSRLKHRCDYLESTKNLLQEKSRLDDESLTVSYHYDSLPRSKKGKAQSTKSSHSDGDGVRFARPRLPSAEDAKCIEFDLGDSGSDQAPKRPKGALFKRSFSTGSLEVPSDIMEQSGEEEIGSPHMLTDPFERKLSSKISKSPETKRKSKFSKWAKVKKVLTKQQLSENISSGIKSIKGLGKGAYFRYGSVSGRELAVPSVAESRSVDSGVGSGMDGETQDIRKSTSSGEPPSPTRFIERHIDVPTPQIDDCMGIWLGPPEWIEKEREKEQQLLKQSATLSESPKSEPGDIGSPRSVSGYEEEGEQFLQVPIPRRQSSPLLIDEPEEVDFDAHLKRTTSYKEEIKETEDAFQKIEKGEKKHKTAWGKMKNIIHTRKDSDKKKRKGRESDSFGFEEVSETDLEVSDDMRYAHEGYLEGPVSRSTPKTSPVVFRQKQRDKSVSPPGKGQDSTTKGQMIPGGSIDVSALMGGVSDEFTRKLQEWEELKGKRSSGHYKESSEFSESVSYESAGAVSPEFMKKLEEWEKVKSLKGIPVAEKKVEGQIEGEGEGESSSDEIEESSTPPERQRQSINVDEIQRKLTDSFSRKMEEWEKQKYRRQNSQPSEQKDVAQKSSFKDRPKSKKTKEEKEREKMEKLREREVLRVEREQQKLEKERMRIEKERLKALEREAKIEKMKGRLSQPDMDTKFKNPILSPLTEYKVTADFARKLHEWEVMKGKEMSTAMYLEAQKRSLQFSMEYQNATNMLSKNGGQEITTTDTDDQQMRKTSSESDDLFVMEEQEKMPTPPLKKGEKPAPLTLIPYYDSPEPSPGAPVSDSSSLDDQTTETMESMTQANIMSLEKANNQLLYELRERELEYNSLQEEVRDLNERLVTFRKEHAVELEMYKKQMMEGIPQRQVITLETRHMTQTLTHLEEKIGELKKFGEQLAMSMEGAAVSYVGKFQTVEGEESINNRLVDLLDKMRLLLQQATKSGENTLEEVSKKSSALHNFEKLYSQAMQLQVQMNNLRLSQLERNKEIMMMKRQLLLQEANNLILQADVTRREADLLYYKEYAQKRVPIKRWNTYSGKEDRANMPDHETTQKQSIFQRVQRLRSIRPLTSSTTDSDSDVPTKSSPARRESPRVRKRESPKLRKKESPKLYKRESPSSRRKESPAMKRRESPSMRRKESPTTKRKESPILQPCSTTDLYALEQSIERKEEHVRTSSSKRLSGIRESGEVQFSTVTLPTAKVTLPKDISPHEMNGVPRSTRDKGGSPQSKAKIEKQVDEKVVKDTRKTSETKFPELLIPEWKKIPSEGRKVQLQKVPSVERDDVFESDNEEVIESKTASMQTAEIVTSKKVRIQEMSKLAVDVSFDSSETSEDTLKYLSPEASPAPKVEPPKFPDEITIIHKSTIDNETVSDPGQSRPNSMVRVAIETPRTPVLLRRPPLGQSRSRYQTSKLNIPVIPLRRIKPAQELLEDSQKYRSGHSIYLTRILKRYPMKIECRSRSLEDRQNADKENIKAGYVKAIVKQLSREGTPSSHTSSPKIQLRRDQPVILESELPKPEFVQHIVHKLSSPCGPSTERASSALKDLTNDGQVRTMREAFKNGSAGSISEQGSDGNGRFVSVVIKSRGSQDITASHQSSSSTSTITFSQLSTRTEPGQQPDSAISSKIIYSSMPLLSLEEADGMRERSATTSNGSGGVSPAHGTSYSPKDSPSQRHKIHVAVSMSPGRSRRIIDPTMSPARLRRLMDPASPGRRRRIHEPSPIEQVVVEEPLEASISVAQSEALPSSIEYVPRRSPKSKQKHKSEKGTIGVLCRQSMTFDLGVSLQGAAGAEGGEQGEEPRSQTLPIRHSTSSTASTSSQSEVEVVPGPSKEKKKSRNKFLDSAFIQKSKKFFRVSKENRCPSLECCGSDREVITV